MKEFVDTSVLVAAFWRGNPQHTASLALVSGAHKKDAACAAHTLAEVYATMTALPVKDIIPPEAALLFVEEIRDRFTIITPTQDDYLETIEQASARGLSSGRIYDALLLCCAVKVKAEIIYTWNVKHFKAIAPQQAERIRTP